MPMYLYQYTKHGGGRIKNLARAGGRAGPRREAGPRPESFSGKRDTPFRNLILDKGETAMEKTMPDWRNRGVRIVRHDRFEHSARSWPGMEVGEAVTHASTGANRIWAGTVTIRPDAKTRPHHHGALESIIYVISGTARMRWGSRLEYAAEAGPGDFIYIPPYLPHQEMNGSAEEPLVCLLIRNNRDPIDVRVDVEAAETPETVDWTEPGQPPGPAGPTDAESRR